MQIIFVNYYKFIDSSGIHIYFLANEFEKMGISCTVCIPTDQDVPVPFGDYKFRICTFNHFTGLTKQVLDKFTDNKTIIHAWTPRENVRVYTNRLTDYLGLPYYIHLEDNEEAILTNEMGMRLDEINRISRKHLRNSLPTNIINPHYYKKMF